MENMTELQIPARDWGKYWYGYILHFFQGLAVGMAMMLWQFEIPAAYLGFLCFYQYIEFKRRYDTPGRDVSDIGIGLTLGLVVGGILRVFGLGA